MKISRLIFLISEDCNFFCDYCYQTKEKKDMSWETAEKIVTFFLPEMPKAYQLYFLGGEPLLNVDLIRKIVEYVEKKNLELKKTCQYNISTNGSLITSEILDFFNRNHFSVELSFDGLAQEKGRKKGSFNQLLPVIEKLKNLPDIHLLVNSVFYPKTINYLSESIQFIMDLGVNHISLGLAIDKRWNRPTIKKFENEFKQLMDILMDHYQETGNQPLHFFPDLNEKGIWCCSAGQSQITISAEGEVWGCARFYEYFKNRKNSDQYQNYYFGPLDKFIKNQEKKYPELIKNYKQLCLDNFHTTRSRCFLCPYIEKCGVCPISSALYWDDLEKVPAHICRINQIAIREKEKLLNRIKKIDKCKN